MIYFVFFLGLFSFNIYANTNQSLRSCLLLPITEVPELKNAFQLQIDLEEKFASNEHCLYHQQREFLSILENYQRNLHEYLQDPAVIGVLAEKTQTGSIVRIHLENENESLKAKIQIIDSNTKALLVNEEVEINPEDEKMIDRLWPIVLQYLERIPYEYLVTNREDSSIWLSGMGPAKVGDIVDIVRPVTQEKHPHLKTVLDWQVTPIAKLKVLKVSEFTLEAQILSSTGELKVGDWGKLAGDRIEGMRATEWREEERVTTKDYRRIGEIAPFVNFGQFTRLYAVSGNNKSISGIDYGAGIKGEIWATRSIFLDFLTDFKWGTLSKVDGEGLSATYPLTSKRYQFRGGYRYLPLNHFYGPRLEGLIGYMSSSLATGGTASDKMSDAIYSGPTLGVRGDMPLIKDLRLQMAVDFMFLGSLTETPKSGGTSATSIYAYGLLFGGRYQLFPMWALELTGGMTFYQASFGSETRNEQELSGLLASVITF